MFAHWDSVWSGSNPRRCRPWSWLARARACSCTLKPQDPDLACNPARAQVRTSNAFNLGMVAVLAACTAALGPLAMFKLYFVPYWVNVVWLDVVTYLHHHGPQDAGEKIPWYRGKVHPQGPDPRP